GGRRSRGSPWIDELEAQVFKAADIAGGEISADCQCGSRNQCVKSLNGSSCTTACCDDLGVVVGCNFVEGQNAVSEILYEHGFGCCNQRSAAATLWQSDDPKEYFCLVDACRVELRFRACRNPGDNGRIGIRSHQFRNDIGI